MTEYCSFNTEYGADKLYQAIMRRDKAAVEQLKAQGVSLTENVKRVLVGGSAASDKPAASFWQSYVTDIWRIGAEGFVYVSRAFHEEIGEPLYYSKFFADSIADFYYDREVFACIIECYDQKKINKKNTLSWLVLKNRPDLLEICANAGWLSNPKKRDELIQYASEKGITECAAWLMDFKSRTADFAAEREKKEKKIQQTLNASPDSLTALKQIWGFTKRDDGTLCITSYKGGSIVIEVPETLGGKTVTAIGRGAFSPDGTRKTDVVKANMRQITKVTLPKTINKIDSRAFCDCQELSEVNIPEGVTEIEENTFWGCINLKSVEIPDSVTRIGVSAFGNCKSLTKVNIPQSITKIEMSAFDNCKSLTEVNIPKSVTKIGISAFGGCESLTGVKIPEGVTEIEGMTFMDCPKLQTVSIPESVEKIATGSFVRCHSLRHIELPNSVTQIDMRMIIACGSLETVTIPASVAVIKNPEDILTESPNVTVIVEPDSYAEKICKRYKIPYKYKEDV